MQGQQGRSYLSAAVLALAMPGAGEAVAADLFRACADGNNHQVRPSSIQVNSAPQCTAKESVHTWNQAGPQGPAGPQGSQGPAGPSAVYTRYGQPLVSLGTTPAGSFPYETPTEITTFTLPPGYYVVTASLSRIVNSAFTEGERAEVRCVIKSPDGAHIEGEPVHATIGPRQTGSLLVTAVALPVATKTYSLVCFNRDPVGALVVGEYRIQATRVGSLHGM